MRTGLTRLSAVFGCGISLILNAAQLPRIELIVSDAEGVVGQEALKQQGFDVKIYNLDAPKRLLERIAQHLPPNQQAATSTLSQRGVQQQFEAAYQGLSVAARYGVNHYPAIIFNQGEAVIYGVTDLPRALNLYRHWQHDDKP